MSLSKTLYPLLSTGSTQEDLSRHNWKTVDWDVKNQHKQILDNWQFKLEIVTTVKPVLTGHSKRRPKIGFQD